MRDIHHVTNFTGGLRTRAQQYVEGIFLLMDINDNLIPPSTALNVIYPRVCKLTTIHHPYIHSYSQTLGYTTQSLDADRPVGKHAVPSLSKTSSPNTICAPVFALPTRLRSTATRSAIIFPAKPLAAGHVWRPTPNGMYASRWSFVSSAKRLGRNIRASGPQIRVS